jgi:AraC family transcriptional regulator
MTTLAGPAVRHDGQVRLGKAKVDAFGCSASRLARDQELLGTGIKFFRKATDHQKLGSVSTSGDDRGFLVGVSQSAGHSRRIFREHSSASYDFMEGGIYIRNLEDDYRADMHGDFDFALVEISRRFLSGVAEEHGFGTDVHLAPTTGAIDNAFAALVQPILPAMEARRQLPRLLLDQLETKIALYLLRHHNARQKPSFRPSTSRAQMSIAMEMLDSNLDGNLPVAELAQACGLSRGYFIRAFRDETGKTPHQWLLCRRLDRARTLLSCSQMSLADIALACGFADQSHFTRLFSRVIGQPPGTWRREARI